MFTKYHQSLYCNTSVKWAICFFCLIAFNASGNSPELTLAEYAKRSLGNVRLLRHAFAPEMDANGQPDKFKIDDCSTQRNLDSIGVEQATLIGKRFIANGIKFGIIYSSQWCRCLETAQLLDLGEVTREVALNSGFRKLFKLEKSLARLRIMLDSLKDEEKLVLMVTHSGVISAITGVNVKSGGAVAYNIKTKISKIISIE